MQSVNEIKIDQDENLKVKELKIKIKDSHSIIYKRSKNKKKIVLSGKLNISFFQKYS